VATKHFAIWAATRRESGPQTAQKEVGPQPRTGSGRSFNSITHYEVLGVAPTASQQEIRGAYRRLARVHHPDHDAADTGTMAALNEAYRVLRNPARRAAYDAELTVREGFSRTSAARTTVQRAAPPARPPLVITDDHRPARYPWKLVVAGSVLGAAVVLGAAALSEPSEPPRPDNLLEPGSCVAIEANNDAREVTCAGTGNELVVRQLVPLDGVCPAGLAAYRDRQGMGYACVSRE
jgi:hypothetical protein